VVVGFFHAWFHVEVGLIPSITIWCYVACLHVEINKIVWITLLYIGYKICAQVIGMLLYCGIIQCNQEVVIYSGNIFFLVVMEGMQQPI
jgi:hypothetical protein